MTPLPRRSTVSLPAALVAPVQVSAALGGWRATSMAAPQPGPSSLMVSGVSYNRARLTLRALDDPRTVDLPAALEPEGD